MEEIKPEKSKMPTLIFVFVLRSQIVRDDGYY